MVTQVTEWWPEATNSPTHAFSSGKLIEEHEWHRGEGGEIETFNSASAQREKEEERERRNRVTHQSKRIHVHVFYWIHEARASHASEREKLLLWCVLCHHAMCVTGRLPVDGRPFTASTLSINYNDRPSEATVYLTQCIIWMGLFNVPVTKILCTMVM